MTFQLSLFQQNSIHSLFEVHYMLLSPLRLIVSYINDLFSKFIFSLLETPVYPILWLINGLACLNHPDNG